jgi:hypothetical protein
MRFGLLLEMSADLLGRSRAAAHLVRSESIDHDLDAN